MFLQKNNNNNNNCKNLGKIISLNDIITKLKPTHFCCCHSNQHILKWEKLEKFHMASQTLGSTLSILQLYLNPYNTKSVQHK